MRIDVAAAVDGQRDGVDGEIARREVGLDPVSQGREVDGPARPERHSPRAVALRQWKERASRGGRVRSRSRLRIGAGDVQVDDGSPEQVVAHGAADHVGLLACDGGTDAFIHRQPSGLRAAGRRGCRT
jgi:hypothetical protein